MIFVIRAGARPRNIVRKLINKRNAGNFDILLTSLAKSLDIETGTVKRIFTIYGRPVRPSAESSRSGIPISPFRD